MDRDWREELEDLMESHLPSLFLLRQVASEAEEEDKINEAIEGTRLWAGREVFMASSLCKLLQVCIIYSNAQVFRTVQCVHVCMRVCVHVCMRVCAHACMSTRCSVEHSGTHCYCTIHTVDLHVKEAWELCRNIMSQNLILHAITFRPHCNHAYACYMYRTSWNFPVRIYFRFIWQLA